MPAEGIIRKVAFSNININDPFFDSLKVAYAEFAAWFERKAKEEAYVVFDDQNLVQAFLYVKIEKGPVIDVTPPLRTASCLKVGTLKINARGTKLGERFVKKIMDTSLVNGLRHAYVTVFPEHEVLIDILKRYGFVKYGKKVTPNGEEEVYLKDMTRSTDDLCLDYPLIDARKSNKWLLSVYPKWHSKLFPDSILNNEQTSIIDDVSFTNSIHKAYLGFAVELPQIAKGDSIVIYRCMDAAYGSGAWYRSVATSLCVVQEVKPKSAFASEQEFVDYCRKYSVFEENELREMYQKRMRTQLHVVKMTYNVAFPKRPNLKTLVEKAGLPEPGTAYYGLLRLTDPQFNNVLALGQIYEGLVIN